MTPPAAAEPNVTHIVTGHGGTRLSGTEFGNADVPSILLIHGRSQCHLSWLQQFSGPLAERFRLIAPDLRGHGQSGKPAEPAAYDNSPPWVRNIAAIIDQLGLIRPLLVGWSMGGRVLMNYLRVHGEAAISSAAYFGTAATSGRHRPARAAVQRSSDPAVAALDMYEADLDADLGSTNCPSLITARAREQIMPMALTDELSGALPQAETLIYADRVHSPFWKGPERFNADLSAFAARSQEAGT